VVTELHTPQRKKTSLDFGDLVDAFDQLSHEFDMEDRGESRRETPKDIEWNPKDR